MKTNSTVRQLLTKSVVSCQEGVEDFGEAELG